MEFGLDPSGGFPKLDRRLSGPSQQAVATLESLNEKYQAMRAAVDNFYEELMSGLITIDDLVRIKHALEQLNGNLDAFQFGEVDSVMTEDLYSGKSLAKGERKVLNREIDELRLRVVNLHDLIVQTLSKNLERSIDDDEDDDDDYFEGSRGGADGREEEYEDDFDIMEDEDVDMPPEGEEPELSAWESSYAMPMSPLDLPPDAQSAFIARQSSWGDDSEAGQFGDTLSEALDDAPPSKATLPMTREALESRVTDLEAMLDERDERINDLVSRIRAVSARLQGDGDEEEEEEGGDDDTKLAAVAAAFDDAFGDDDEEDEEDDDNKLAAVAAAFDDAFGDDDEEEEEEKAGGSSAADEEEARKTLKPRVTEAQAKDLVKKIWGLTATGGMKNLVSYDDVNFMIQVGKGKKARRYTLKIHNGVESGGGAEGIIGAQNALMLHLSSQGLACPTPVAASSSSDAAKKGDLMAFVSLPTARGGEVKLCVRLLTWVEGSPMADTGSDEISLELAGVFLGRVSKALASFDHQAAHRDHAWDLRRTLDIRKFTKHIPDSAKRGMVEQVIDAFEKVVLPLAKDLPSGIIVGDYNDANIILDGDKAAVEAGNATVAGIIDFGDMVHSWRINELAIATAYGMLSSWGKGQPLAAASAMLRGAAATNAITPVEASVLRILIAGRLACSYTFGMYGFSLDPTNKYLLFHAEPAGLTLETWWVTTPAPVVENLIQSAVANHYPLLCAIRDPNFRP